jgi:hypothetical protein
MLSVKNSAPFAVIAAFPAMPLMKASSMMPVSVHDQFPD